MSTPLAHAVQQVEEFVARDGWDQTPRMFALAWASELVSTEPDLAEELGIKPNILKKAIRLAHKAEFGREQQDHATLETILTTVGKTL